MSLSSVTSYADGDPLTPAHLNSKLDPLISAISNSVGGVQSVFGRTSVVTAVTGDYTFAQISTTPTTLAGYGITDAAALVHTHAASDITTGTLAIARGGTALGDTPANGQLLIGNGTGYSLATIVAGTNIAITNGAGTITIAATGGGSGTTITGSGTTNYLPLWTSATGLSDSRLSQSGDTVGMLGHLSVQSRVVAALFAGSGASLSALSATAISTGTVATARLGSGTANSSTFLRGDQTWAAPPGGGSGVTGSGTAGTLVRFSGADTVEDSRVQDSASLTTFLNPSVFSSAVTINGVLAANGSIALGDSGADTLTVTARIASNIESNADTYQVGTSGQPFHRVYLGGGTPGLYVSGSQVVGARSTGWGWTFQNAANKASSTAGIQNPPATIEGAAPLTSVQELESLVRAMYDAMVAHGLIGS